MKGLDIAHPHPHTHVYPAHGRRRFAERIGRRSRLAKERISGVTERLLRPSTARVEDLPDRLVVHGAHHKVMTNYFADTFALVAAHLGLRLWIGPQSEMPAGGIDLFLQHNSRLDWNALGACRGSHIIRDPRDVLVSGYFYHLWTDELEVVRPDPQTRRSWQQELRIRSEEDGLLYEVDRAAWNVTDMLQWDYGRGEILELRYEEFFEDPSDKQKRALFEHYGFARDALEIAVRTMGSLSLDKRTPRPSGTEQRGALLRRGVPGDWRNHFTPAIERSFKDRHGQALIDLGYERDFDW